MFIWWSTDLYMFHNDAYLPCLGKKPQLPGRKARDVWYDVMDQLGEVVDAVLNGEEQFYFDELLLLMERKGFIEETYWTFSYGPMPHDDGSVGGLLCSCVEVTAQVLNQRRLQTIKNIVEATNLHTSIEATCQAACDVLGANEKDLPFVLIYLLDAASNQARLIGQAGKVSESLAPAVIELLEPTDQIAWPLTTVKQTGQPLVQVSDIWLPQSSVQLRVDGVAQAVILPIRKPSNNQVIGFFISGISCRLEYNADYQGFFALLTRHIATAIAQVQSWMETARQQQQLYSLFMEASAPIVILDGPDMVFELVNPAYQQIFPGRALLGKPLREALPEVAEAPIIGILADVYQTGNSFVARELPLLLARTEGAPLENIYWNFTYQARRNEQGKVDGIMVFANEVTDQVLARQAIEKNAEQLRLITDALPVSIVYVDKEKHYRFANRLAIEWRRGKVEDVIDKRIEDVVGQKAFESVSGYIDRALAGESVRFEMPINYPAGRRFAQSHYVPHVQDGEVMGFYAMVIDITEQVEARREANRHRQRLNNLFMQAPAPISILEGKDLVFELVNPAYQQMFPGRKLMGRSLLEALPEVAGTITGHNFQQVYQTGITYEEKEILIPVARYENEPLEDIYFNFIIQARYNEHGHIDGVLVFAFEVTDQVLARQKVETNEKNLQSITEELAASNEEILASNNELELVNATLARVNADLDTFVYTASHDLKSPVTSLETLLTLLSKRLTGKLEPKEQEMMRMILLSSSRLQSTISDLTQIAKIQRNTEEQREMVYFGEMLAETRAELANLIEETGAQLSVSLQIDGLMYTRKNIRSILYNLISNSLKYRSPERLLHIQISTYQVNEKTVLEVGDNGLGLSETHQEKLFTMFKRFHSHVEGSGIGLYMIKRIVENNGGRIEAESELGKGTTFRICF
jgi:PAS domain S-box-containing protein